MSKITKLGGLNLNLPFHNIYKKCMSDFTVNQGKGIICTCILKGAHH